MATAYRAYIRTIRGYRTARKGDNNMGIPTSELVDCNLKEMIAVAAKYGFRFVKSHDGLVEFEKN